jgi:hypothetical protein
MAEKVIPDAVPSAAANQQESLFEDEPTTCRRDDVTERGSRAREIGRTDGP